MALLKAVGKILAKLKKPKRVVDGKSSSPKDTSDMVAYPRRDGYIDDRYSKSLHRGKKQSEGFKDSGHFDRRKSNDRRAETKSAKSDRVNRDIKVSALEATGIAVPVAAAGVGVGMGAKTLNDKRKKRKLNARKKAESVNEEKSLEGTFKKYKNSKLRKATPKDIAELQDRN